MEGNCTDEMVVVVVEGKGGRVLSVAEKGCLKQSSEVGNSPPSKVIQPVCWEAFQEELGRLFRRFCFIQESLEGDDSASDPEEADSLEVLLEAVTYRCQALAKEQVLAIAS